MPMIHPSYIQRAGGFCIFYFVFKKNLFTHFVTFKNDIFAVIVFNFQIAKVPDTTFICY